MLSILSCEIRPPCMKKSYMRPKYTFNSLLRDQIIHRLRGNCQTRYFQFSLARSGGGIGLHEKLKFFFQFSLARSVMPPKRRKYSDNFFQFSLARSDVCIFDLQAFSFSLSILSCEISEHENRQIVERLKQLFQFSLARSDFKNLYSEAECQSYFQFSLARSDTAVSYEPPIYKSFQFSLARSAYDNLYRT